MKYSVIVVGAGHAGIEAVNILNHFRIPVLLITQNADKIGFPSCNPSIGGIAKSHLVYELDALGGLMPIIADRAGIHFKLLNSSKGPAVWSLRAQIDIDVYTQLMRNAIEDMQYADIMEDEAEAILYEGNTVTGILTAGGKRINAGIVIVCSGTFLNGTVHMGKETFNAGRYNDNASVKLANQMKTMGFQTARLKTGTSPRVIADSVDFSQMEEQPGESNTGTFSISSSSTNNSHACYITRTNKETHSIINDNLEHSALYSGTITGIGPKYCPSIEDKVVRFAHRDSHIVFIEPMGEKRNTLYLNGVSTSLPQELQYKFIHTIKGLEKAEFTQPGYAIEYDYFTSSQIDRSLQSKQYRGLFLAGQVNGTSGYEEAAAQGFAAGLNATMMILERNPVVFDRYNSYIGVLIDDITSRDITEPYRLFTSRAENRLVLRQDNAFVRMNSIANVIPQFTQKQSYKQLIAEYDDLLKTVYTENHTLQKDFHMFRDPSIPFPQFRLKTDQFSSRAALCIYSEIKYRGYIERFRNLNNRIAKFLNIPLSGIGEITDSHIISKESRSIIENGDMKTIGDLKGRIDPADIENIILYLERKGN